MSAQWLLPGMTRVAPFSSVKSLHRPHRVALDLEAGGELEEVERPLVTVHELRGLARSDLDHLGQMQLVARRVIAEHAVERAEHERVRGKIAKPAASARGARRCAACCGR